MNRFVSSMELTAAYRKEKFFHSSLLKKNEGIGPIRVLQKEKLFKVAYSIQNCD